MNRHLTEKPFKCPQCDRRFTMQPSLKQHLNTHKKEKPGFVSVTVNQVSPTSGEQLSPASDLSSNIHTHTENQPKEEQPDKKLHTESQGSVHGTRAKRVKNQQHICSHCGREFHQSSTLMLHMSSHSRTIRLDCDESTLRTHTNTQTGERVYECPHCKKRFIRHENLKAHMAIHTGNMRYACSLCDRRGIRGGGS